MIFGFGKKRAEEEAADEEVEQVLFQGALSGREVDLAGNARLAKVAFGPTKSLVTDALLRRADLIRLEPKGERTAILLSIDGLPYPGGRMSKQQGNAITQMVKLLAGLDVQERGKPQAGGMKAEWEETTYRMRVESVPVPGGAERLTVRIRNLHEKLETPDDLGFPEEMRTKIREMTSHKSGVVLVCGPPYSGTSTTTFAVLRTIDAYLFAVYSIASDTEGRELVNITEFDVEPDDDLDTTLQRCIRMEPDVIFLDPIRDADTARTVFKKQPKTTFLSEFRAKDAAQGILQLIEWIEDPQVVAEGLRGIFNQKLIRRLCEDCKEAYPPNPKLLSKVGLPPETKILYRPPRPPDVPQKGEEFEPCESCGGTGYIGRVGMFEVIEMTDAMRQLVARNPSADEIKALARQEKMQTLQKDALRLVAEGATSLEELQRAFKAAS